MFAQPVVWPWRTSAVGSFSCVSVVETGKANPQWTE